ncbi:MAG: TolC family protein [Gemmatimonadaceae bacterium]
MRSLLLGALLAPSIVAAQNDAVRPISLDEALRLAQRNAPATVQARGQIASGGAAVRSAYGAFLPTLSLNASGVRQGGDRFDPQGRLVPFIGEAWQYGDGISSSLELFDGFRRFNNLQSARADLAAAEANETLAEFRLALDVKQQYYGVLAARESESAARSQLEQAEQQLRAASARVAQGAATKSDSLRSVIQVGNARLALLTAQNNVRVGNATLTRLVGSPFTVTALDDTSDIPLITQSDSTQLALWTSDGPATRQAQASASAARAGSKAARAPYFPSLTLSFSRSGSGTDNRFGFGDKRYAYSDNLRVGLSFPLFNGFTREENVVRARVQEDLAAAQLRDTRLAAQQQLVQYLGALRLAEERVQIQRASLAAADEDLRVQQQRYALGASTLLDLLTSQSTLNQARASLIQARHDARVAHAQIEALVGREFR